MFFLVQSIYSQYLIEGNVLELNKNTEYIAYLDIIENWNDFQNITKENILKYTEVDSLGYFKFSGNEFSDKKGFYRIHFAPKNRPNLLIGSGKNYTNFILSNHDTISLTLKSKTFSSIQYLSSSIPENKELQTISLIIDSLKISTTKAIFSDNEIELLSSESDSIKVYTSKNSPLTENLLKLISVKKQTYLLEKIKSNDNALVNMYSLYYANLNYTEYYDLYQEIYKNLKKPEYRESYNKSLSQFISKNSHEKNTKTINHLYILIIGLVTICVMLIGYIFYTKKNKPTSNIKKSNIDNLTSKELQVYELILEHKTNKEIAALLFISSATVKTHINNIYRKLGTKSRSELIQLFKK